LVATTDVPGDGANADRTLADWFVAGKVSGELAKKGPVSENTRLDLEWRPPYSNEHRGATVIHKFGR
jgi:hypothetical protein